MVWPEDRTLDDLRIPARPVSIMSRSMSGPLHPASSSASVNDYCQIFRIIRSRITGVSEFVAFQSEPGTIPCWRPGRLCKFIGVAMLSGMAIGISGDLLTFSFNRVLQDPSLYPSGVAITIVFSSFSTAPYCGSETGTIRWAIHEKIGRSERISNLRPPRPERGMLLKNSMNSTKFVIVNLLLFYSCSLKRVAIGSQYYCELGLCRYKCFTLS